MADLVDQTFCRRPGLQQVRSNGICAYGGGLVSLSQPALCCVTLMVTSVFSIHFARLSSDDCLGNKTEY